MCKDGGLFDAIAASAHGVYACSRQQLDTKATSSVLFHRARALSEMQKRLSDSTSATSNETMLAAFYLLENAARFKHIQDFRAHYSGLRKMMKLRGQITPSCLEETYVNQAIVILEASEIAWTTRVAIEKPPRLRLTYPTVPLEPHLQESVCFLPVGFQHLANDGSLSIEMLSLLADVPPADYIEHDLKASERQLEVVQRARIILRTSRVSVERLVCMGSIAFSLRTVITKQFFSEPSFWKRLAATGKIVSESSNDRLCQELRVWVTVIAADLASTACEDLAREALIEIKRQETWTHSWDEVQCAMKKFFYLENFALAWQDCWKNAIVE